MAKVNNRQLMDGRLLIEEYQPDGSLGKQVRFGGTASVSQTTQLETIEGKNTEGILPGGRFTDSSDIVDNNTTLTITTQDVTAKMLSRANMATMTTVTQAGGTANPLVIASASLGTIENIGEVSVSNVVVKDATDTITYVSGTDYEVNNKWGTIEFLDGGSIVDASEVHLTYDSAAIKITKLEALTDTSKEYRLTWEGNASVGLNTRTVYEKVSMRVNGDQAKKLESSEYTTLTFEAKVLIVDNKPPFVDETY